MSVPEIVTLSHEPPMGSVVAIDWGGHRPEVWVANSASIGNWYTPDIPDPKFAVAGRPAGCPSRPQSSWKAHANEHY